MLKAVAALARKNVELYLEYFLAIEVVLAGGCYCYFTDTCYSDLLFFCVR